MKYTDKEKNIILSNFTKMLKETNGKGPKNISIKYYDAELHITMRGVISDFEKYLINNFGKEAIDTFESFYQRDCYNAEKRFKDMFDNEVSLSFKELKTDFDKDIFVYIMSYD